MGLRRQSRENALHALYIVDLTSVPPKKAYSWIHRGSVPEDSATAYSIRLFEGTIKEQSALDEVIQKISTNWKISRMAAVDRSILRLAAYEILHCPDTPVKVVIDEAIEIARKYSTEDSTSFINGILDKIKGSRPA